MFRRKNKLGELLKSQAESLGACKRGTDGLENLNEQELANRYIHFIRFSSENGFPSSDFVKRHFDSELRHRNNIYVDEEVQRRNARQVVVLQGSCTGLLLYDGMTVADVYVRDDSQITIDCSRMSKVFVCVYDRAKVNIVQDDGASVFVYKHSNDCVVETEGEVMIRNSVKGSSQQQ